MYTPPVPRGENTRNPDMIFFTSNAQVKEMEPIIRAYLREAMGYAEQGLKPEKVVHEVDMPDELIDALDSDPELAEAFEGVVLALHRHDQPVGSHQGVDRHQVERGRAVHEYVRILGGGTRQGAQSELG